MAAIARTDLPRGTLGTYRRRSQRRKESGAELIEFAFVLPLLLLVIVGIFDFGFLFQTYEVVTNAAREGARAGVLPDYDGNDAAVRSRVLDYLTAAGHPDPTPAGGAIDVQFGCVPYSSWPPPSPPCTGASSRGVVVTVWYPHRYVFLGPIATLFGGSFNSITVRATSAMRSEPR